MSSRRSCLADLSRFRNSAHGHAEFGGLNRVVMVRKLEERTFNAKNGQEVVTRETIETFRGNEKTDRKITRLLKPNALNRLPSNLSTSLSEDVPLEEENFEQDFLRAINKLRHKHGAPNLHISDRLRSDSQNLAECLARGKSLEEAINDTGTQNLGLNIYWSKPNIPATATGTIAHWYREGKYFVPKESENCDSDQFRSSSEFDHSQSEQETSEAPKIHNSVTFNGATVTQNGDNKQFDIYESDASTSNLKFSKRYTKCDNFTQMLWKSSLQVGAARATSSNGRTVIVALFQPKGNLFGQYCENLPRSESLESIDSNASSEFSRATFHNNTNFRDECLKAHNKLRALHGAPPLRLSKKLCKYSQQWANTLAIRGRLEHRPHSEFGENLYCTWDRLAASFGSTNSKIASRDLSNYSWSQSEIDSSSVSKSSLRSKSSLPNLSPITPKTRSDSRLSNDTPTSPAATTFLTTSRTTSSCSENLPSLCSGKMSPCVGFKSAINGKSKMNSNGCNKSVKKSTRAIPERPVTAPPKQSIGSKIVRRSSCVFPQRSNTIPRPSAFERRQIRTASLCSGSVPERMLTPPNGREPVERWYAEVGQHEFYKEPSTLRTGHFTQVVWNDSRELGVGVASNKQGQIFVVANYYPPGNFLGSFSHNVPPIGGFKTALTDEEDDKFYNGENMFDKGKLNGINKNNNESSGESDDVFYDINDKIQKNKSLKSRKKLIDGYKENDKNIARINGIINNKLHEIYEWDEFVLQGLKVHNEYRKKHGVPNLILSQELCESAREWSKKLARMNKFQHRPSCELGENIFVVWSSDVSDHISARDVIRCWYEENREYDWDAKGKARGGAQFTQIVWRATKELGMAVSSNGRGKIYVVANYRPRGNVIGQFSENVNRPL